jgi:hypothetical protein
VDYTVQMSSGFLVNDLVFPIGTACSNPTLTWVTATPDEFTVTTAAQRRCRAA